MRPYYDHAGIQIFLGDCREILPHLKADVVVTDPPYGVEAAAWDARVPYEMLAPMLDSSVGAVVWFGAATKLWEAADYFTAKRLAQEVLPFNESHMPRLPPILHREGQPETTLFNQVPTSAS